MQAEVAAIASSPWLALVSGVSSVLGCLLAVYSVQISGIEPSVYRGLIWEKTLLWSAGLGIIVASVVLIYGEAVRNPESPVGQMIYSLPAQVYESTPREQVTVEDPIIANSMPTANLPAGAGNTGGAATSTQPGAGNTGGTSTRTQSGGNTSGADGGSTQGSGGIELQQTPANPGLVTGINTGPAYRADGTRVWLIALLIGFVLAAVGYAKDPFKATIENLKALDEELASGREIFMKRIKGSGETEGATLVEIYDRNANVTRTALFSMLTGYRLPLSSAGGSYLSTHDLHALASLMASTKRRSKVDED